MGRGANSNADDIPSGWSRDNGKEPLCMASTDILTFLINERV